MGFPKGHKHSSETRQRMSEAHLARPKKPIRMAECHPEKRHFAKNKCRPCYYRSLDNADQRRAQSREWARNNPHKIRNTSLKRNYGITLEEFNTLLTAQGNKCAICRQSMAQACLDHDHKTGQVRGILCQKCNQGIGLFGDDTSVLEAAKAYLERGGAVQ